MEVYRQSVFVPGIWERMIRTIKDLLKKTIGKSSLNQDELHTLLKEVECIINSRPLVYVSEIDGIDLPITPSHLISGRRLTAPAIILPPDDDHLESSVTLLTRRETHRQHLLKRWWKAWKHEYMLDLGRFHDIGKKGREIRVGEVVLIQQDIIRRALWKSGLVIEVIPGRDGVVRMAKLRTETGIINRPIQRLFPTEGKIECSNETPTEEPQEKERSDPQEERQNTMEAPETATADADGDLDQETNPRVECVGNNTFTRTGRLIRAPIRFRTATVSDFPIDR